VFLELEVVALVGFGTKSLAITFVSSESDQQTMAARAIQSRSEMAVPELPEHIDPVSYSASDIINTVSCSISDVLILVFQLNSTAWSLAKECIIPHT
jgi:hypothetical protein